ncbi:MAG TPA: hypothetical protein VGJ75_26775 [Dongiaceae bacterium]|jgi:hypothetical protein
MEILGEAGVFIHPVGKHEGAHEEEQGGVADDEEIDFEGPDLDARQAELEPPEMHDRKQQEQRPAEMHQIDSVARRMLDKARQPGQQPRHGEAGDDPDDDADVNELVVRELLVHSRSP